VLPDASPVGLRNDEHHVVTGANQGAQRDNGRFGSAEKGEAHLVAKEAMQAVRIVRGDQRALFAKQNLGLPTLIGVEALDQEHTVEVIHLVLEDAALVFVGLNVYFVSVEVEASEVHGIGASDVPTESGTDRQPS